METQSRRVGVEALVDALAHRACREEGIPSAIAVEAAAATLRRMAGAVDPFTASGRGRVAAYFWAVVRRRALSGRAGTARYRARCLAATLAAELVGAGHDPGRVRDEVTRAYGPVDLAAFAEL
jgi:hypothetical protein